MNIDWKLDLAKPEHAYMFGFIQADGHLQQNTRNRGKLQIELQESDRDVLEKFKEIIPFNTFLSTRTRDTNFKDNYTSAILVIHNQQFREGLIRIGLTYGKKSDIISAPKVDVSVVDYWRGMIDGDGSLGLTEKEFPFLSLNCSSEQMANDYIQFLFSITGKLKTTSRNKRDNTYNICVNKEDAQEVVKKLYYDNSIALNRKKVLAKIVLDWKRPSTMRRRDYQVKSWDKMEDKYILSHSVDASVKKLKRTEKSIKIRIWRLRNGKSKRSGC